MIQQKIYPKKLFLYIGLFLLSLMLVYSIHFLYKKGRQMAIAQLSGLLQKEIKKQKLNIQWQSLHISLVPLRVHWEKVSMDIPSAFFPAPLTADSLTVKPDYMGFLKRKLLFKAEAENLSAQIKMPDSLIHSRSKKKKRAFAFPDDLPLSQVQLKNANLLLISSTHRAHMKKADILLNLQTSAITMASRIGFIKTGERPAFSSVLNITLTPDRVKVPLFLLKSESSLLKLSGRIKGQLEPLKLNSGQIKAEGDFVMEDLSAILKIAHPSFKNPFKGKVALKTQLRYSSSEQWKGDIDIKANQLFADRVFLSQAHLVAQLKKQSMFIERLKIGSTKSWSIALKEGRLRMKKPFSFRTQVMIDSKHLNRLFSDMSLNKIPLYGRLKGLWRCQGQNLFQEPLLEVQCEGESHLRNFKIQQGKKNLILSAPWLSVKNQVSLAHSKAKIQAQLSAPDSNVSMEGSFSPKEGFLSHFNGRFNLIDLENLVYLEPKGIAHIKNSALTILKNKMSFKANLKTEDLILDGFYVGSANTQVDWTEKGILHFRKVKGTFKKSQYKGNVSINIPENSIRVFAHSPFITLQNLKEALKNHIYFPFSIKGKGRFSGYLQGPLQANILSYTLSAQLFDVFWEGESFDKGLLKVESKKGYVKTKQALLTKGPGQVIFKGSVDPKGNLKANLKGEKLSLQSSENISQALGHNLEGDMDFKMSLSGYFLKPFNQTRIQIQNSFFKGYPIGDSTLNLSISRHAILADGSLAEKIKLKKLIFPYKKTGQVKIKTDIKGLNIKELFFSKSDSSSLYNQFQSHIDGSLDLSYTRDKLVQSITGFIKANKFSLNLPSHQLKNHGSFSLTLDKGSMQIEPFALRSKNHSLSVRQDQKIYITGGLKLDFLIFLFPFMKAWEGGLKVNLNMEPKLFAPAITGEIALQKGFVQLNDYIDPFEESELMARVQKRHINITSLYTKLGGGEIKGQGELFWSPKKNLHVDLKAGFKDVIFSSLPGLFARGQGQVDLKGKGFPYQLGMNARLKELRVEKEFKSNSSASIQLSQRLLSLQESKKKQGPLILDLSLFPQKPIQIENSVMRANWTGNIKVTGPPENPLLTGTLKALPGGLVRFRDHDFRLRTTQIRYNKASPANPVIDLRAHSSIREEPSANASGETAVESFSNEYQVRLRVKGKGQNPQFRLSATPSLSEKEIVSLLAFGARSVKFEPGNPLNNITRYSYAHLGPALFQKAIGRELKNTLGVVDQFLIIPHISSKTSAPTTKMIVRKTMFNRLDLSSSHTLLDEERESDIKAKYKINQNVSLIGLWQNESLKEGRDDESNTLGLNLEYQIDF